MAAVNKKTDLSLSFFIKALIHPWGTHKDENSIYPETRNVKIAKSQKKSVTFSAYMRAVQAAIYVPRHAKVLETQAFLYRKSKSPFEPTICIQLFQESLSEKVHAKIPERHCGWFWVQCSSKKFERMAQEAMDVFATAKGSNKSRFDWLHCQEQGIDHIQYYLSGLSRAHFFRHAFNSCKQRCLAAVMPHKSNTRNNLVTSRENEELHYSHKFFFFFLIRKQKLRLNDFYTV